MPLTRRAFVLGLLSTHPVLAAQSLTAASWATLERVNREINRLPLPDCKAYAAAKLDALRALGWSDPYLADCWVPQNGPIPDAPVINHRVCCVPTSIGIYVLSNGVDEPMLMDELDWVNWKRV
jgi:predicted transglutaminase-like cysteine proteinase